MRPKCFQPGFSLICLALLVAVVTSGAPGSPSVVAQSSDVPPLNPQTWQVMIDNVSPPGHLWTFESFHPSHLQVHPGDTVTFTLAQNPNAVHTVTVLGADVVPEIRCLA